MLNWINVICRLTRGFCMKKMVCVLLLVLSTTHLTQGSDDSVSKTPTSCPMIIELSGYEPDMTPVYGAIYNDESVFLEEGGPVSYFKTLAIANMRIVKTESLAEGRYAITVYHDQNKNNELDSNFLGIPSEPVALSNDYSPSLDRPVMNPHRSYITVISQN